MKSAIWPAVALMVLADGAFAGEKRQSDAHEHGHGTFQMVIEDDHAVIEIAVPAFDVIGFEHAPSTSAQRDVLAKTAASLSRPDILFAVPAAAECAIGRIEIGFGATGGDHDDHDGHDDHDDHKDHDDHADKDGHKDHDDHEEAGETHSEVTASYHLACAHTEALDRIEFGYFEAFPAAEELDVVILSAAGQSAGDVDRNKTVFRIE
jgi:hypothetical protein